MANSDWQWNEMQQVGTDYSDIAEVEVYDRRMAQLRDVAAESRDMLAMLALAAGSAILEIGCGTGQFARAAALAGMKVTAIDISAIMLAFVRARAAGEGCEIATQHAGFLTMNFPDETFDAVVSGLALHHLPDVWKYVALRNIVRVLRPGGQLILRDVVFACHDRESPETELASLVNSTPAAMYKEVARHIATEYSTYDWIMQGLIERAGFTILATAKPAPAQLIYHCRTS